MEITTIRTLAGGCPVDNVCPSIHKLDTHPERTYVISKVETDPAILAVFAPHLQVWEVVGWAPNRLFAGLPPWAELHKLDTHPERTYVISKVETDPAILAVFAPLLGHDEQLGWTLARVPAGAR